MRVKITQGFKALLLFCLSIALIKWSIFIEWKSFEEWFSSIELFTFVAQQLKTIGNFVLVVTPLLLCFLGIVLLYYVITIVKPVDQAKEEEKIEVLKQRKPKDGWEYLDEERAHMENVVNSRFSNLLVVMAAIFAGVIATKDPILTKLLFLFGAAIALAFYVAIVRADVRLDALLRMIYTNDDHASTFSKKYAEEGLQSCRWHPGKRKAKHLIAHFIPITFCIIMVLGATNTDMFISEKSLDKHINETDVEIQNTIKDLEARILSLEKQLETQNTD